MTVIKPIPRYFFDDAGAAIETDRRDLGDWMRAEDVEAVFQPHVAYMPVPRCDLCSQWSHDAEQRCAYFGVTTAPDDGCVKHEPQKDADV